jgi:hypothetical protein
MTSPACTGFQSLPNERAKFFEVDGFGEVFIEDAAWLSEQGRRRFTFLQDFDHFRAPEEFGQGERIDRGVLSERLSGLEAYAAARSCRRHLDTPPRRHKGLGLVQVALTDNQSRPVQNQTVRGNLGRQPLKGVRIAFDFVAVQVAVHDRDIDPAGAMAQAQFVEHQRIGVAVMLLQHLPMQSLPDVSISHD